MWLLQNEKQAFLRWVTRKNKKTLTYNRRAAGAISKAFAGEQSAILAQ